MSDPKLLKYLEIADQAVNAGCKILEDYFGNIKKIEEKHKAGLVSEADKEAEKAIKKVLLEATPEFTILAEESGVHKGSSEFRWILDPLDGTTNYIHQLPFFAVSLGLQKGEKMQLGIVNAPLLKKKYHATAGGGAYLNDAAISVTATEEMKNSLIATGFAGARSGAVADQLKAVENLVLCTRGIRRLGSAAIDLCMVAEGLFDGFFEGHLQPWDVAAGALIVMEAGGTVSNFENAAFDPEDDSIAASNGKIHQALLKRIR